MAHQMISKSEAFQKHAFAELQKLKNEANKAEAQFGPDDERTKDLRKQQEVQFDIWNDMTSLKHHHDF